MWHYFACNTWLKTIQHAFKQLQIKVIIAIILPCTNHIYVGGRLAAWKRILYSNCKAVQDGAINQHHVVCICQNIVYITIPPILQPTQVLCSICNRFSDIPSKKYGESKLSGLILRSFASRVRYRISNADLSIIC